MKKWIFILFAPILLLIDFLLKQFVLHKAALNVFSESFFHLKVLPFVDFDLTYVENTGMAWGMFSSFQSIILALRILLIVGIIVGLFRFKRMQKQAIAYLLIIFGAFGNVLDTFLYGYVVDMLHFTFFGNSYGVFNVADAMIFAGVIMIAFTKETPHAAKE